MLWLTKFYGSLTCRNLNTHGFSYARYPKEKRLDEGKKNTLACVRDSINLSSGVFCLGFALVWTLKLLERSIFVPWSDHQIPDWRGAPLKIDVHRWQHWYVFPKLSCWECCTCLLSSKAGQWFCCGWTPFPLMLDLPIPFQLPKK